MRKIDLSKPKKEIVRLATDAWFRNSDRTKSEIARQYKIALSTLTRHIEKRNQTIPDKRARRFSTDKGKENLKEIVKLTHYGSYGMREGFPDFYDFVKRYFSNSPCSECGNGITHNMPEFHKEIIAEVIKPENTNLLINLPPRHGKTTLLSVWYVLWRIVGNPNIRVLIVSQNSELAKPILNKIKMHLEDADWYEQTKQAGNLVDDFGPFRNKALSNDFWSQSKITLSRAVSAKDPTVSCVGIGSSISGKRADLLIVDDIVNSQTNPDSQSSDRIMRNLYTNIMPTASGEIAKCIFVGSRVSPVDIYSIIAKWSDIKHIKYPCIISEKNAHTGEPGKTLWGEHFNYQQAIETHKDVGLKDWDLIYQNFESSATTNVFTEEMLDNIQDPTRSLGEMSESWEVVGGVDPAVTGTTSIVIVGLDTETGKRYLIDNHAQKGMGVDDTKSKILDFTQYYKVSEWVIETNGFQKQLFQDDKEFKNKLRAYGAIATPHTTTGQKWDYHLGVVGSFRPLLDEPQPDCLYSFPMADSLGNEVSTMLIHEMKVFYKNASKQDRIMSLWFAEIGIKKILKQL